MNKDTFTWMIVAASGLALGSAAKAQQTGATTNPPQAQQPAPAAPATTTPPPAPAAAVEQPLGPAAQDAPSIRIGENTRPTRADAGGPPGLTFELRPNTQYTFEADLDDASGKVSIFRAGVGLGMSAPVGDRARFLLNVDSEWSNYDFSGVNGLLQTGPGDGPIEDAWLVRIAPGLVYQVDENWGVTGGGIIELAWEDDADMSEAATYGGYVGARYSFAPGQSITFGVIAKTQLEDDTQFLPLLGLEWQLNDHMLLENDGLGLRLTAVINDHWRASIFGRYEQREYRLNEDALATEGVTSDVRVPVGVALIWRPSASVSIRGHAGVIVYQKYEVDDANGNEVGSDETDPAAFVGIFARFAF